MIQLPLMAKKKAKYPCPNPGKAVGVAATVRRVLKEPGFARFIRHLLRLIHQDPPDPDAVDCLKSYYSGPTKSELEELGIPKKDWPHYMMAHCTDTHFIDGAAFYGRAEKRRKKH